MADSEHINHPDQWTTGSEPSTEKQRAFLQTLGHGDPSSLSKSEASEQIDKLKNSSGPPPQQSTTTSNDTPDSKAQQTSGSGSAGSSSADAPIQDPKEWATGDEPATGKQKGYIAVMAQDADEPIPSNLNKSEASEKIAELKAKTGK